MKSRVGIGRKEVEEDISEKKGSKCSKCRCSMTNEAIFKMEYIMVIHFHTIHLLYHRAEGDLQRREYAQQYGSEYNVVVPHNHLLHLPVVAAICKKDRGT